MPKYLSRTKALAATSCGLPWATKRPSINTMTRSATPKTASISPDVNDPGARNVNFDQLCSSYAEQAEVLIDAGADIILIETVFDTLNCKAAIFAVQSVFEKKQTHCYVNLRCAKVVNHSLYAFVGAGITSESNEQEEWKETENKSRTLLDLLEMH